MDGSDAQMPLQFLWQGLSSCSYRTAQAFLVAQSQYWYCAPSSVRVLWEGLPRCYLPVWGLGVKHPAYPFLSVNLGWWRPQSATLRSPWPVSLLQLKENVLIACQYEYYNSCFCKEHSGVFFFFFLQSEGYLHLLRKVPDDRRPFPNRAATVISLITLQFLALIGHELSLFIHFPVSVFCHCFWWSWCLW